MYFSIQPWFFAISGIAFRSQKKKKKRNWFKIYIKKLKIKFLKIYQSLKKKMLTRKNLYSIHFDEILTIINTNKLY